MTDEKGGDSSGKETKDRAQEAQDGKETQEGQERRAQVIAASLLYETICQIAIVVPGCLWMDLASVQGAARHRLIKGEPLLGIEPLIAALQDQNERGRRSAVEALRRIGARETLEVAAAQGLPFC